MPFTDRHTNASIRTTTRWLMAFVALTFILTGCGPANEARAALPDDGPDPAVSGEAALRFIRKSAAAGQQLADQNTFTLVLTEAEVTSFLNVRAEVVRQMQTQGLAQVQGLDELNQLEDFESLAGLEGLGDLGVEGVDVDLLRRLFLGSDRMDGRGGLRDRLGLRFGLRRPSVRFRADGQVIARGTLTLLRWAWPVRFVLAPHAADGELSFDFVEGQVGSLPVPGLLFDLLGRGVAAALMAGQDVAQITQIRVEAGTFTLSGRVK
jgi:hypothetical protein